MSDSGDFDPQEIDPEEMVKFDNKDLSLLTVVRHLKKLTLSPGEKAHVAVFREGDPSILDWSHIEELAKLPAFKEP
jgi:hypothetical protein